MDSFTPKGVIGGEAPYFVGEETKSVTCCYCESSATCPKKHTRRVDLYGPKEMNKEEVFVISYWGIYTFESWSEIIKEKSQILLGYCREMDLSEDKENIDNGRKEEMRIPLGGVGGGKTMHPLDLDSLRDKLHKLCHDWATRYENKFKIREVLAEIDNVKVRDEEIERLLQTYSYWDDGSDDQISTFSSDENKSTYIYGKKKSKNKETNKINPYKNRRKQDQQNNIGHGSGKHICITCNHRFRSPSGLKQHHDAVHLGLKPYKCKEQECGKYFSRTDHLKQHHNSVHLELKPHMCLEKGCEKSFFQAGDLKKHHDAVHLGLKPHICLEKGCGKFFTQACNLKQHHDAVHLGLKPHSCLEKGCGKFFPSASNLKKHHDAVHLELKPHMCLEKGCEKSFPSASNLKLHHDAVHLGLKPHICLEKGCGKFFTQAGSLKKHHDAVHLELKPHMCLEKGCEKSFSQAGDLKQHHGAVHLGLQPYTCLEKGCGKSFSQAGGLKKHHDAVHLELKPHACLEKGCGKSFYLASGLKLHHDAVHLGLKPHACQFLQCDFAATTKTNINKHFKSMHTADGTARRKESEDRLHIALLSAGLKFRRSKRICLKSIGGTSVELDFVDEEKKTHVTVIENDEYGHKHYERKKELNRPNVVAVSDWHKAHIVNNNKLITYRFNPHRYKVDHDPGEVTYDQGVEWMANDIKTYIPKLDNEMVYVRFPARTHDNGMILPRVLDEDEFPENLKNRVRYFG